MLSIKKIKNINLYNLFILVFLISSCSSMNVTEEVVYDGGIRTVEASMQENTELDYVVLRLGPVFGIDHTCTSVICDLVNSIMKKQAFEIWGNGQRKLQPTYVEDIAMGCLLSLKCSNEIFNIISPERYSIVQIAKMLKEQFSLEYYTDKTKPDGQKYPNISANKAINTLKWKNTPLISAIKEIVESTN